MRLQALMVNLVPDTEKIMASRSFACKGAELLEAGRYAKDLYLGVENKDKCFITKSHFKAEKGGYYIPAFRIIDLDGNDSSSNYTIRYSPMKEECDTDLYYDAEYDLFYDKPAVKVNRQNWHYDNEIDKASVGTINAGNFYLYVYKKDTNTKMNIRPYKMCVLPSSMSIEQYELMINDLLNIEHELLLEETSSAKQSVQTNWELSLNEIEKLIKQIKNPLKAIDRDPKVRLYKELDKVSPRKIRKFTSKTILEMAVNQGTQKCTAYVDKEDTDIYENQMILYALSSLKSYVGKFNNYVSGKTLAKIAEYEAEHDKLLKYYNAASLKDIKTLINDKSAFYDVMVDGRKAAEINKQGTVRVQVPISKYLSDDYNLKMYFAGGKLHSKFVAKDFEYIGGTPKYSLDYDRKCYTILDDTNKQIRINGQKVILDLETNDERQHLLLKYMIDNRNYRNLTIEARVKICGNDSYDVLRGNQVYNSKGEPYYNTYEYNIEIVELYSINGLTVDNVKDASSIKESFIEKGFIINQDLLLAQIEMLQKKRISLKNELIGISNRDVQAFGISKDLDELLKLKFFKNISRKKNKWKLTQIFANDKNYSKVYAQLYKLDKKLKFSDSYNAQDLIHKKADKLYEYWMLIKMLQVLVSEQQWKLEGKSSIRALIADILRYSRQLESAEIMLSHKGRVKDQNIKMKLLYNHQFSNKKTPDFAFDIIVEGTSGIKEKWFYLDAKYRDYANMRQDQWYDDINTVAIGKYINSFKNTETKATASFIAHTDTEEKYVYFGGYTNKEITEKLSNYGGLNQESAFGSFERLNANPNHKFGSFYFLPGHTEHFKIFMKIILEYHFMEKQVWAVCWDCGSINTKVETKQTKGSNNKYYVTCKDCNSFWVRTHCEENAHKLVKHGFGNYHKETSEGDPWYVKCPKCDYKAYEKNTVKISNMKVF